MAIPTMFHSSSSIEASAMAYLAEDTSNSVTDMGHDPMIQTETATLMQETGTEETGITAVAAQTEGGRWQEFSPSLVEHNLFQSQFRSRIHNKEHREGTGDGRERHKEADGQGQQRWRDRIVKKSLNGEEEKRAPPLIFPEQEDNHSSPHSTVKVCSRPEYESREHCATLASAFPHHRSQYLECPLSSAVGLCLHRLKVGCCSDIYSSNGGGSGCAELNSDPESVYIYAESIKGCDSICCSLLRECDSDCLYTEVPQREDGSYNTMERKKGGACKIKKRLNSFNSDTEALCMYTEDSSCFDMPDYSIEAVVGSDNSCESFRCDCDSDSPSAYADWESSFDSNGAEASVDSLDSLAEAQWGSVSSRLSSGSDASCYTADCGSESSYGTVERSSSLDSEGPFAAGQYDSPISYIQEDSYDLYNAWTESSDVDKNLYRSQTMDGGTGFPCLKDDSELTLNELRGVVTHTDCCRFSLFFREMVKEAAQDRDQEKLNVSEGFLFHPQKFLQAKNSEYREGREYSLLRNIQNGSYGDVFSIRDKQTGFTCAAKRIPLCSFSWEEVGTWSRLDSPHVLQLYGAVREGLNVVLFMDLKTGSLAQLLKARGSLPEDMALYYHSQVLQALEHLHSRQVIHLDIKVDNVLLSKDRRECFLCDFGLSEMLDKTGCSTKTFRGNGLRGTESHMAPEVARGDPRSDKADVWSSCCMLLHMLTGHQPWTRYYTHPLCLKIVSEPAPLWEIPPGCDPLTCEVIRGGLVKEPKERDSARKLLEKATKALRAVGGFSDPVLSHRSHTLELQNCPPVSLQEIPPLIAQATQETLPPVSAIAAPTSTSQQDFSAPRIQWVSTWRERAEEEDKTDSEERESDEESEWDHGGWMEELKRDKMRVWMERYWGTEQYSSIRRNKKQTLLEDEREPRQERGDEDDIYTELEKVSDEQEDHESGGGPGEADSEEMDDTDAAADCVLDEESPYEGETRSPVDEAEGESEVDDAEEEVESDLDSLRELGSDWAEEEWEPFHRLQILYGTKAQNKPYLKSEDDHSDTEEESEASTTASGKMTLHEQNSKLTLTCHRSTCASEPDLTDKNSDWSDDLSSGVFSSYSSLTDGQSFNVDWSVSTHQPPSCCFEGLGVDIWVEDVSGETLRIRERLKVKLGHVAVGISAQISMRTFSLATLDGKLVSPDTELLESGMWLQCVPAPDGSTNWDWRVRDGKLEKQEHDEGASDTCSTLAA
ncbi:uncharacterized protein LOC118822540 isoform X2 [Colossoma macropomum]|uniref:uncharacterized protein LOC118822540 isoform X2 n=1 Tax=Colossoma macropomum TaxID=42526 RepID=UPI0018656442|nr:uncharacterized protein LOC118822540 isoform X2 [Colossoma macropomum]